MIAGGREVVSDGWMSERSMKANVAREGTKETIIQYDEKRKRSVCQTYTRDVFIF